MTILLEHQAKALLKRYGIPVTIPRLAKSAKSAEKFAEECDGKVAMKIASMDIVHKAEIGGVHLNISPKDAANVFHEIMSASKYNNNLDIEGVIVEPMVDPGKEIIIGGVFNPLFGPTIMLGSGGAHVEDLRNVVFRLAPLDEKDAFDMIEEIGAVIVGAKKLDKSDKVVNTLVNILLSVGGSKGVLLAESLRELDINPLIISGDSIIAVDAHAVKLEKNAETFSKYGIINKGEYNKLEKHTFESLLPLFYPECIAVIGASAKPGKLGFRILQNLVDGRFPGKIYAVHPSAQSIYGCPVFPSVEKLPGSVDRAIIAITAENVPEVLIQCSKKGVRVAQILTAGFSEWSADGETLTDAIKDIAKTTRMRIVGPNTIGTYCAEGQISMSSHRHLPKKTGGITFISQSGTYAWDMIHRSKIQGLPLGKSLSCGNCSDVKPSDYLIFSARDRDTDVVALYLESDEDAGRFFRFAKNIKKPLVLFKGGRSSAGVKVATSHTGALAGDYNLWKSAGRQADLKIVDSIDELLDLLLAIHAFGEIPGNRIALFGSGGGVSVVAADLAATNNMEFASLSENTKTHLEKFGVPGTSISNPIDIPVWGLKDEKGFIFHEMIELLIQDPNVDSIITYVEMNSVFEFSDDIQAGIDQMDSIMESLLKTNTKGVAISAVLRSAGDKIQDDFLRTARPRFLENGIAVYPTTARAIRSHAKLVKSGQFLI